MRRFFRKEPPKGNWRGCTLALLLTAILPYTLLADTNSLSKSILDSLQFITAPEDQADYLLRKILTNDLHDLNLQAPLLNRLEDIAIEHRMNDKLVTTYTARGYILVLVPDYYNAMYNFRKAYNITLREKGKDWEIRRLKTAINIAGVYSEIGDFDKTAEFNSKNLVLAERLKDSIVLADVYQSIAVNSINRAQIDTSILFAQKAVNLYDYLGLTHKKHIAETTLAEAYGKSGQPEQIRSSNQKLEALILQYTSPPNLELLATMYGTITKNYLTIGENEQAHQAARSALDILGYTDDKTMNAYRLTIYQSLSEVFHQKGQIDSAYHYLQLATNLKETLINEKRIREIATIESAFLIQEKNSTINKLATFNDKNQITIYWLTAGVILFFLMTTGIFWLYLKLNKKKNQLNQLKEQLTQTNDKLKTAISQRQQYINLIVHDIKSPLFSAYISTQMLGKKNINNQTPNLTSLQNALSKIEAAVSKILEIENTISSESYLNIKPFNLGHMLSETISAFSITAEAKNVKLSFSPPSETIVVESDFHILQHALENIVSNGIKYAPPGSVVAATVNKRQTGIQIAIRNSVSPSNPPPDFPDSTTFRDLDMSSWSKGLKLSAALLKEIDGEILLNYSSARTKEFVISIPNHLTYQETE
jgi:signal transduction histidine kinase